MMNEMTKIHETAKEAKANAGTLIIRAGGLGLFSPETDSDPKAVALKHRYINGYENEQTIGMAVERAWGEMERIQLRMDEIKGRLSGDDDIVAIAGRLARAVTELNTAIKARAFYKDLLA